MISQIGIGNGFSDKTRFRCHYFFFDFSAAAAYNKVLKKLRESIHM